jgi:hypothetical protein
VPKPKVTAVEDDEVVWRLPHSEREPDKVRLWADFDLGDTSFQSGDDSWELRLPREKLPPVDRLEYLFEVTHGKETATLLDPGNPLTVGGAFGDHSWLPLGYQPPAWLALEPVQGNRQRLTITGTPVGEIDVEIWSPDGTRRDDPLPLLLSHDGPEMDHLGELTRFVGAMIALRQAQGAGGLLRARGAGRCSRERGLPCPELVEGLASVGQCFRRRLLACGCPRVLVADRPRTIPTHSSVSACGSSRRHARPIRVEARSLTGRATTSRRAWVWASEWAVR